MKTSIDELLAQTGVPLKDTMYTLSENQINGFLLPPETSFVWSRRKNGREITGFRIVFRNGCGKRNKILRTKGF